VVDLNDEITRRAALTRFAAVAGGVATSTLAPTSLAHASPVAGFNARRRGVFEALAEAMNGWGPIDVSGRELAAQMADRWAGASNGYREWTDSLLDAVDSAPAGARFSEQGLSARRRELHRWSTATEPADKLLYRPRPSDSTGSKTLAARNEEGLAQIRRAWEAIPESKRRPDPHTALLPNAPTTPPGPPITDEKGPVGTPVRLRRYLYHSAYMLLASLVIEDFDPKYVPVEVVR
jgi:hypothetical protein